MSSATAQAGPEIDGGTGLWRRFRNWRRSRPFWGGLLAMIAGVPILYFPYAELSFNGMTMAMSTTAGAGSLIIGVLMICLGATAWFQPLVRIFCGVATTLLSLISIPVANFGGFGLGFIPGLIAGGLLMAWAPLPPAPAPGAVAEGPAAAAAADAGPGTAEYEAEQPEETTTAVLPVQHGPVDAGAPAAGPGEPR